MRHHTRVSVVFAGWWWVHGLAIVMLGGIIGTTALLWPVAQLPWNIDLPSGTINAVEPNSGLAQAGIQPGDRLLGLYGYPWAHAGTTWLLVPLDTYAANTIPMTLERNGQVFRVELPRTIPSLAFRFAKSIVCTIALACWLIGYYLCITQRSARSNTTLVGCFWLCVGGLISTYFFALTVSQPLLVLAQVLVIFGCVPLFVYVHLCYPVQVAARFRRAARWYFASVPVIVAASVVAVTHMNSRAMFALNTQLHYIMLLLIAAGWFMVVGILRHVYQRASLASVRRTIRLLLLACVLATTIWITSHVAGAAMLRRYPAAAYALDLVVVLVPAAYFLADVLADLYRAERIMRHVSLHVFAIAGVALLLVGALTLLGARGIFIIVSTAVVFGLLYRAAMRILNALFRPDSSRDLYLAMQTPMDQLATTLDPQQIGAILADAVTRLFDPLAVGLYLKTMHDDSFTLVQQASLPHAPQHVAGSLFQQLNRNGAVLEHRTVVQLAEHVALHANERALVDERDVALWCLCRHAQGHVLGVLLLGIRSNLDAYHAADLEALRYSMHAAGLALTNSLAYQEQRAAEDTIQSLYHRVQRIGSETAADIAREIHDEIININVRLNIQSLEVLHANAPDARTRQEAQLLLESEQTVAQMLRLVCERLHMRTLNDPFGLPTVLRQIAEQYRTLWPGALDVVVEQLPLPLSTPIQRSMAQIAQEALMNAIKHAQHATSICILLRYPAEETTVIELTISDDGQNPPEATRILPKRGHLGIRSMYEGAYAVGGRLDVVREPDGTRVTLLWEPPLAEAAMVMTNGSTEQFLL